MPANLAALCDDLAAEHADLDRIVAGLKPEDWDKQTPAEGWLVRDQILHIAFGDDRARLAVTDRTAFEAHKANPGERAATREQMMRRGRELAPADLLAYWREEREKLLQAFRSLDPSTRVPWFGPDMSPASFITARVMETWAHGQDIVDTVGGERPLTPRLRHIAHIGVRARPYSYTVNDKQLPAEDVAVELTAPNGETWRWGDPAAPNIVRGAARDFCLVVTQRRHPADTNLTVAGPLAQDWIAIAQAFAGPAGTGRRPGQFPKSAG